MIDSKYTGLTIRQVFQAYEMFYTELVEVINNNVLIIFSYNPSL